ncbi:MerR family transcriptional regulator [Leucobacter chinensis]|uniref:MerR family transcriptional regulator n=1 Tax=Leucobacter chinensis TaxID=2851010 RepID=UPI001C23C8FF|nr:MerR family transcriptional regulator [Leucobacter chinensis]
MRSSELARLAGVTVRALRHYHQVGVLEEPERGANGYRDYTVHDLIRVLRIKRLSSLGIALEQMPDLLDQPETPISDPQTGTQELLAQLDEELVSEIERLQQQRALIEQLRSHLAAPDTPPEIAPFLTALTTEDLPAWYGSFDRDQAVLLAHFAGEGGMNHLVELYRQLSSEEFAPAVSSMNRRFAELGDNTSEDEISDLVEHFLKVFAPLITSYAAHESPFEATGAADLLAQHSADVLNRQQRAVLLQLETRLSELISLPEQTP